MFEKIRMPQQWGWLNSRLYSSQIYLYFFLIWLTFKLEQIHVSFFVFFFFLKEKFLQKKKIQENVLETVTYCVSKTTRFPLTLQLLNGTSTCGAALWKGKVCS